MSLLVSYFAAKHPMLSSDGMEVFVFDPSFGFLRVSSFGPLPQSVKDGVIHFHKSPLTGYMPVVVGPPPDNRVELHDQMSGCSLCVGFYDDTDFVQEP